MARSFFNPGVFHYVLLIFFTKATDAESPTSHPHQGKVLPFQAGPPKVELDGKAERILSNGKPFQSQIQLETSGRGLVIQDVKAPTHIVWEKILDYDNYAKMVPKTIESENYKVHVHDDNSQTIYTRMKVGFPLIKLEFFIKHEYKPELNSLTWTLDYSKKSDFDDSCGYWYVIPHPSNPNWSRVYYSVELALFDWMPKFVMNFISNKALTDATSWVKQFSEMKQQTSDVTLIVSKTMTTKKDKNARSEVYVIDNKEECSTAIIKISKPFCRSRFVMLCTVVILQGYNVYNFFLGDIKR
mmetsp:Transcript_6790/g.7707  ORF Transcript_6790/g.7707 Transcript_6790/m.7707 type:complete len:299 (+) Transcript_6790:96-992(+)